MKDIRSDIAGVLNAHCKENGSNTPDWILAEYMMLCLDAFDGAVNARASWYGRTDNPGQVDEPASTGTVMGIPYVCDPRMPPNTIAIMHKDGSLGPVMKVTPDEPVEEQSK